MKNQQRFMFEEKGEITKAVKKEINIIREWFSRSTSGGHVINDLNGVIAVGICDELQDNLTTESNSIWIYASAYNWSRDEEHEELINAVMSEDEAMDLLQCLKTVLEKENKKI